MNGYLNELPRQAYFHQVIPASCAICVTIGHPLQIPTNEQSETAKSTINTWFKYLDALNIKGAASVAYDEILFKRFPKYDHFTGRSIYTAFKVFEAACRTSETIPVNTHILGGKLLCH